MNKLNNKLNNKLLKYLYLLLGSIAYLCSSGRYNIAIMAWIWPFLFLLYLHKDKYKKDIFILTLVMGIIGIIKWYGAAASSVFINILIGLALGIIMAIPFIIYNVLETKIVGYKKTLLLPALFSLEEVIMNILPCSMIGNIASTQASFTIFIQSASIIGSVGLTFIIIGFSSTLFYTVSNLKKSFKGLLIYGLLLLVSLSYGVIRLNTRKEINETVKVALTTGPYLGDFTQEDYTQLSLSENINHLKSDIEKAKNQDAEILVFSEEAFYINDNEEETLLNEAQMLAKEAKMALILTTELRDTDNSQKGLDNNRAYIISYNGEVIYQYDKTHLVTLVETSEVVSSNNAIYNGYLEVASGQSVKISTLICMDGDAVYFVRENVAKDCGILFIPTYDWECISQYHANNVLLRSVENGVNIVRSTYDGISYVTDSYGRILDSFSTNDVGYEYIATFNVNTTGISTVYKKLGIIVDILPLLIILGLVSSIFKNKFTNKFENKFKKKKKCH